MVFFTPSKEYLEQIEKQVVSMRFKNKPMNKEDQGQEMSLQNALYSDYRVAWEKAAFLYSIDDLYANFNFPSFYYVICWSLCPLCGCPCL